MYNNYVHNLLQQNTEGAFKLYDFTDQHNVDSGGVTSHTTKNICCESNTTALVDDYILMRLDDTYAYFQKFSTHLTIYTLEE